MAYTRDQIRDYVIENGTEVIADPLDRVRAALGIKTLSPTARIVAAYLASYGWEIHIPQARIAHDLGLEKPNVSRATIELERHGFGKHYFNDGGSGKKVTYKLSLEAIAEAYANQKSYESDRIHPPTFSRIP